jgi:hypothetical protein
MDAKTKVRTTWTRWHMHTRHRYKISSQSVHRVRRYSSCTVKPACSTITIDRIFFSAAEKFHLIQVLDIKLKIITTVRVIRQEKYSVLYRFFLTHVPLQQQHWVPLHADTKKLTRSLRLFKMNLKRAPICAQINWGLHIPLRICTNKKKIHNSSFTNQCL